MAVKRMQEMFFFQPPAGVPISLRDIASAIRRSSGEAPPAFARLVGDFVGVKHAFDFNSGRTALSVILRALVEMSNDKRDVVVMPAYTCFSVASSIAKCGLGIMLCDVDPKTLDYDFEQLDKSDFSRVIALIGCSLFGKLCDWDSLNRIADNRDLFLIDDAAQSFGCSDGCRMSGTMGDAGFFSFGRGKNLSTYSGGIALTENPELASRIERISESLPRPGSMDRSMTLVKMTAYSLLLRPELYWLPKSMPFLGLGETVFDPEFEMARLGNLQARLGEIMFSHTGLLNSVRENISRQMIERLSKVSGLFIPGADSERPIPYLRLPVLLPDRKSRDIAIRRLRHQGIGASSMYPSAIDQIPGIDDHLANPGTELPGAKSLSGRLMTLPTHPYMREKDIDTIVQVLTDLAGLKG